MDAARRLKPWLLLPVAVLALGAGYALARYVHRGNDIVDAIGAVQRRSPRFVISEPRPQPGWPECGTVYLCRDPRTATEIECLGKDPSRADMRWNGVVCIRGTMYQQPIILPWITDGGDRCVEYTKFAVFGDPVLLQEVTAILDEAGFQRKQAGIQW